MSTQLCEEPKMVPIIEMFTNEHLTEECIQVSREYQRQSRWGNWYQIVVLDESTGSYWQYEIEEPGGDGEWPEDDDEFECTLVVPATETVVREYFAPCLIDEENT